MSKIRVLSDIHSNSEALRAVLSSSSDIDKIFCCGDVIGYYPNVSQTVDLLKEYGVVSIKGNHEQSVCNNAPISTNQVGLDSFDMTIRNMTREDRAYLESLPQELSVQFDGVRLFLVHGGPEDCFSQYIYPDSDISFSSFHPDADIIVLGHTHFPMLAKRDGRIVLNPGSCGQPRDLDFRASSVVVDTVERTVCFHRHIYDVDSFFRECLAKGVNEELALRLYAGGPVSIGEFAKKPELFEKFAVSLKSDKRTITPFERMLIIQNKGEAGYISLYSAANKIILKSSPIAYTWQLGGHNRENAHNDHFKVSGRLSFLMAEALDISEVASLLDALEREKQELISSFGPNNTFPLEKKHYNF